MANPQLVTYIQSQLSTGASKEAIRSALLGAGWPESDVNDAMGSGSTAQPAVSAIQPAVSETVKSEPVAKSPVSSAMASPAASSPIASSPSTVILKDQIGKQSNANAFSASVSSASANSATSFKVDEVVFNPESSPASSSPVTSSTAGQPAFKAVSVSGHHTSRIWVITSIVFLATTLAAGALAAFFNMEKNDLEGKVHTLTAQAERMASQVSTESTNRKSDAAKTDSLQTQVNDLEQQLSIFLPPMGSAASGDLPISITGKVATDTIGLFTITTSRGLILNIKNSKDSNVSDVLKPLMGTIVTVAGVHSISSKDISFVGLVSPAPSPVHTPTATSTPPVLTTPPSGSVTSTPASKPGATSTAPSAPTAKPYTSTTSVPTSTVPAK